jgi:hypothetical protein
MGDSVNGGIDGDGSARERRNERLPGMSGSGDVLVDLCLPFHTRLYTTYYDRPFHLDPRSFSRIINHHSRARDGQYRTPLHALRHSQDQRQSP